MTKAIRANIATLAAISFTPGVVFKFLSIEIAYVCFCLQFCWAPLNGHCSFNNRTFGKLKLIIIVRHVIVTKITFVTTQSVCWLLPLKLPTWWPTKTTDNNEQQLFNIYIYLS